MGRDGEALDVNKVELVAIATIMATVVIHAISAQLEKALRRHRHLSEMLQKLYRELMVLGVVSLGLFLVQRSSVDLSENDRHLFETVHLTLFLIVVGYVLATILLMVLSVFLSQKWADLEQQDHNEYVEINKEWDSLQIFDQQMSPLQKLVSVSWRRHYNRILEQVLFHNLRLHFIHSNHLPADFSFARYLRKCKQHVFLELGDMHGASWMCLVSIICIDLLQRKAFRSAPEVGVIYFRAVTVILATVLTLLAVTIYAKSRKILNQIMENNELIDFDPVAARYYIEHWRDHERSLPGNSVEYETDDRKKMLFRTESAIRHMGRLFRISEWGNASAASIPDPEIDQDAFLSPIEAPPQLAREQTNLGHLLRIEQMQLFWFGSHIFMLRIIQIAIFMFVFYCAIIAQFSHRLLDDGSNWWLYMVFIVPLPIVLYFLALSFPIYTIVIHVGQLVDLNIVLEAKMKGICATKLRRSGDVASENILPPILRRSATIDILAPSERTRFRLAACLFSKTAQMIVAWLVLLNVFVVCLTFSEAFSNFLGIGLEILNLAFSTTFMIEIGLKIYSVGWGYVASDVLMFMDALVVLVAFSLAIVQFSLLDPAYSAIIFIRLIQVVRAAGAGKLILQAQEHACEAENDQRASADQLEMAALKDPQSNDLYGSMASAPPA